MTFAFDEQFAMFDITPVENQFILEYLPGAKGDFVKVYLYGLLCCYHPKKEMDISNMSRELDMSENDILQAFRYWERNGVVRRIKDHPPEWQYVNIKQKSFSGEVYTDSEYVQFCREVENCFDGIREFHGSEKAMCYDWQESMHLPSEIILMILKYMYKTRGKNFRIRDAEKVAVMLSEEKAFTIEEAEHILGRDEAMNSGFRKVLRKLGKRYSPSDANLKVYKKWIEEWHFSQEAIENACDRTGTSDPSLALVDAILEKTYLSQGDEGKELGVSDLDAYEQKREGLKAVLSEIGHHGSATSSQEKLYGQMTALYPQNIILIAVRECAARQRNLDSVLKLLQSWQDRGFTQEDQIRNHIAAFHDKEEFLRTLRRKWSGNASESGQKALQLLEKWEDQFGFDRVMISLAADYAFEAKKPVTYMDSILSGWAEKGIRTPEEAAKEKMEHGAMTSGTENKKMKKVAAQQYEQRDYSHEQDDAMARMLDMDGGKNDA